MEKRFVYADNAATTPMSETAFNAMKPWLTENYGNPSSLYRIGRAAKEALNDARTVVGKCLNAAEPVNEKNDYAPGEIVFTGGGSQADNLAIRGFMHGPSSKGRKHIITSKIEHHAVLYTCEALEKEGYRVTYLNVDKEGHVDLEQLKNELSEDTALVSVMAANNEIGTVQPVEQLGKLLKAKAPKALFHIDAVQGLCRVRLTPKKWNCDLMSVSGHKIGAPKGIGALYVKKGLRLPPLTFGGGQERGMRPGTEAVPNIAAFAKACEIRMAHFDEDYAHVQELADYLKQQVSAELPDAVINGEGDIPHVVNLSMPGCKSEVMLHVLEGDEVYISSGSACSKGKQSGVLKALGLPKARTDSALRVSFAPFNTKEDVDAFINAVKKGAKMFRR